MNKTQLQAKLAFIIDTAGSPHNTAAQNTAARAVVIRALEDALDAVEYTVLAKAELTPITPAAVLRAVRAAHLPHPAGWGTLRSHLSITPNVYVTYIKGHRRELACVVYGSGDAAVHGVSHDNVEDLVEAIKETLAGNHTPAATL
jgi:hypothetical protein